MIIDWPRGKYNVIYADPPWRFLTYSSKGRDRCPDARHYQTITLDEIKQLPVGELANNDSVLLLWVPDSFIELSFEVIKAWGFTYKTVGFYWTKVKKSGAEHIGTGYWTRSNPELCLLCTRGKPQRNSKSVRKWIHAPVREHSRKPDEAYDRIEKLLNGPYIELFARQSRPGWDAWGDEVGIFDK